MFLVFVHLLNSYLFKSWEGKEEMPSAYCLPIEACNLDCVVLRWPESARRNSNHRTGIEDKLSVTSVSHDCEQI